MGRARAAESPDAKAAEHSGRGCGDNDIHRGDSRNYRSDFSEAGRLYDGDTKGHDMSTPAAAPVKGRLSGFIPRLYYRFQHGSAMLEAPFLLLVRLYWGWQFAQSGWGRLHHLGNATDFFASLGIPAPGATVIAISVLEFVGGLLLIGGLATRFMGLLLAGDMIVAYFLADRDALSAILSNPGKFYGADPYTFLFAALIALIFGAGKWSIDYLIWRRSGC